MTNDESAAQEAKVLGKWSIVALVVIGLVVASSAYRYFSVPASHYNPNSPPPSLDM
jgi:uncharacterized membrane protein